MASVVVEKLAYCKLMLHAAKHFDSSSLCGLCLGTSSGEEGSLKVNIVDCVPLFHQYVLAPLLEACSTMVENYCQSSFSPPLKIVGVYHLAPSSEPLIWATKIASKIESINPGAVLVTINTRRIDDDSDHALQVWGQDRRRGWGANLGAEAAGGAAAALNAALAAGLQHRTADADDHWEAPGEPARDWRNPWVAEFLGGLGL